LTQEEVDMVRKFFGGFAALVAVGLMVLALLIPRFENGGFGGPVREGDTLIGGADSEDDPASQAPGVAGLGFGVLAGVLLLGGKKKSSEETCE
jgi:hypothetical protein